MPTINDNLDDEKSSGSRDKLTSIINSIDELIYTLDLNLRFTTILGKWRQKTDLSTIDIIGRHFNDVLGKEDKDLHDKYNKETLSGKHTIYEWSLTKNNVRIYYQTSLAPITDINNKITGITGIIREITAFKQEEIKLKQDFEIQSAINSIFQLSFQDFPAGTVFDNAAELIMSIPYIAEQQSGIGVFSIDETAGQTPVLMASRYLSSKTKETLREINIEDHYFKKVFQTKSLQFIDSSEPVGDHYKHLLIYRHYCVPVQRLKKILGIIDIFLKNTFQRNSRIEKDLISFAESLASVIDQKNIKKQLEDNAIKFQKMVDRTVFMLSSMIEEKDPYIVGHQKGVGKLSSNIAWELKLSDSQIHGLFIAGLLHDIGKIMIPSEILLKPGKLSVYERNLIKLHPEKGFQLLKHIDFPWPVAQVAYQHHERLNGSGYPLGLTSKDILLESKILAVADVVEAMSSDRPYHKGVEIDVIINELEKNKNVLYDPDVVEACKILLLNGKFSWETI